MDPNQTFNFIQPLLFWLVAGLTGLCAVATVVTQNIVRSATWLLFTLAGVSAVFFLLGADLVGAVQLLVYVGGTLILVVFGVMLTAQGPFVNMRPSGAEWAIAVVAGALLLGVLTTGILTETSLGPPLTRATLLEKEPVVKYAPPKARAHRDDDPATSPQSATIGQAFLGVGAGPAHRTTEVVPAVVDFEPGPQVVVPVATSRVVRMNYLLPFELISVHLLVVLIGAAYLARTKRRRGETS